MVLVVLGITFMILFVAVGLYGNSGDNEFVAGTLALACIAEFYTGLLYAIGATFRSAALTGIAFAGVLLVGGVMFATTTFFLTKIVAVLFPIATHFFFIRRQLGHDNDSPGAETK
ncbi:MAG: hypothetical protein Athens071424_40 [Parcubacteria group bacterium Athens0714_24]|nr:MAG: hypothetical protein Athens071424_40 [Parcubacteria group bacterium Athens0714_24]